MAEEPTPQWQPLEKLSFIAWTIDGMLESAEENYANLQPDRKGPSMPDDYTIGRVIEVYGQQHNDLWLYDEQLKRWAALPLTAAQRQEVSCLTTQMKRLHEVLTAILALADELKEGTIEKVLAKSDAELGMEFLLGLLTAYLPPFINGALLLSRGRFCLYLGCGRISKLPRCTSLMYS